MIGLIFLSHQVTWAESSLRVFQAQKDKIIKVNFNNIEIEVPPNAAGEELNIQQADDNYNGITLPFGFHPISLPYRFGPSGLKFTSGKELKIRLKLDKTALPKEFSLSNVRLYYINRTAGKLEPVTNQNINFETGTLEATITHFSDYVPGVTSGWDGNGLNPFMDYTHNGEENVLLYTQRLSIVSRVISLPGRGRDFNLNRVFSWNGVDYTDPFWIEASWYWGIPHYYNQRLYLPDGTSYDAPPTSYYNKMVKHEDLFTCYYTATRKIKDAEELPGNLYQITLKDGTKITFFSSGQTITYKNGYYINCNQQKFSYLINKNAPIDKQVWHECYRVTSFVDSTGRTFLLNYDQSNMWFNLTNIVQKLSNGSSKIILTRSSIGGNGNYTGFFIDSLGHTTSYEFQKGIDNLGHLKNIWYPTGVHSSYSYNTSPYSVSKQEFYHSGESTPFRSVTYSGYTGPVTVNDGVCKKIYTFSSAGYTTKEETYTLSGSLLKRTTYDGSDAKHPSSITTTFFKTDGSAGQAATYNFEYDDWGNITRTIDPYGTETLMAYANTSSNKNLAQYNPLYQNALYAAGFGYGQMVTKAALIHDAVHNTSQLNQIHYQYDTNGNLLQTSRIYNGSYLNTNYSYDSYGNMLSKTDPQGNTIKIEYSSAYNYLYPTRVYRLDNTTLATFTYDFDLGRKISATDPNGNQYAYSYDSIGRLTSESLINSDPAVGVTRQITYDDTNNIISLKFGNATAGWQEGRIYYDSLFGKPTLIQRLTNGNWIKIKSYNYDTNGRMISESANLGYTTTHGYDELGRKVQTQLPDGAISKYTWNDRTLTVTDARGFQKQQTYDLLDRLVQIQEHPDSNSTYNTTYDYDTFSDLIRVTNPRGAQTIYTYDNLSRLIRLDYPQDGIHPLTAETYSYDNAGNLLTKTTAKGTKQFSYEFFNGYRIKQFAEADDRSVNFTYDANDNILTKTFPIGSYTYHYDARNRVTGLSALLDSNTFTVKYTYDTYGRITGIAYPGRSDSVTYTYDDLDRIVTIPGFVNFCSYDGDSNLNEMDYSNGLKNTHTYDADGRPQKITAGYQGTLIDLNYTYDSAGNIQTLNTDRFTYDGLNRLSTESYQGAGKVGSRWNYDSAGNLSSQETTAIDEIQQKITSISSSYSYDLANRLWSMGSNVYMNDADGDRTSKTDGSDTWSYGYDGESRLTSVIKNGTSVQDNTYDSDGMRIKKVANGNTIYTIYQGANPLLEYSATDGQYTYYIYAGKNSIAEEKGGQKFFYHKDYLGSTRALTDLNGKLVGLCKYDAWGNILNSNEYDQDGFDGHMEQTGKWSPINDLENKITYNSSGGWMDTTNLAVASGGGAQSNALYVSPNSDYVLNGFFKTPSHTATLGKAQLVYFDAAGTLIQTDETNAFGWSDIWSQFTLNSHSPTNAVKMHIRLINGGDSDPVLFDEIRLKLPNLQNQDSYRFTGKKEDDGTGLKYFGARFYDPETGRFMTQDPIKSGVNWYQYCNNNPVKLIDPAGFRYLDPHDNPDYNDDLPIGQRSHDHDFIDKSYNQSSKIGWNLSGIDEDFSYRVGPYKITINLGNSLTVDGELTINLDANGNVSSVIDDKGYEVNVIREGVVGLTVKLIDFSLGKNAQITGSIKGCLSLDFEGDLDLWKADLSNKYGQSIEVTVALCRDLGIHAPALNPAKGFGPLFSPGPWGGWEYQFFN